MRCAIYFTPPPDDPLTIAAAGWLGRDAFTGERVEGTDTAGLLECDRAFLTAPVRRFGFHGTLKAPFRLAASHHLTQIESALERFARHQELVILPEMEIVRIEDFFALAPKEPSTALAALAAAVVAAFDAFRAPLEELDFAQRGRSQLSGRQLEHLMRWGYPYVFEDFRFHLALTGPVPAPERPHVRTVLEHYFGALATAATMVNQLVLFTEPEPYAPFRVHSVHRLAARITRKSA